MDEIFAELDDTDIGSQLTVHSMDDLRARHLTRPRTPQPEARPMDDLFAKLDNTHISPKLTLHNMEDLRALHEEKHQEPAAPTFLSSWAQAYEDGNTLMYLPREIRDMIYHYYMCMEEDHAVRKMNKNNGYARPAICSTSRQIREESMRAFICTKQFFLMPSSLNRNRWVSNVRLLHFKVKVKFMETFDWIQTAMSNGQAFRNVRFLHLGYTSLFTYRPMEGAPHPNGRATSAMAVANACPNLTHLSLGISSKDVRNIPDLHPFGNDLEKYVAETGLGQIFLFRKLKHLVLDIKLMVYAITRFRVHEGFPMLDITPQHFNDHWGLDRWFRAGFRERGQVVDVSLWEDGVEMLMKEWLKNAEP